MFLGGGFVGILLRLGVAGVAVYFLSATVPAWMKIMGASRRATKRQGEVINKYGRNALSKTGIWGRNPSSRLSPAFATASTATYGPRRVNSYPSNSGYTNNCPKERSNPYMNNPREQYNPYQNNPVERKPYRQQSVHEQYKERRDWDQQNVSNDPFQEFMKSRMEFQNSQLDNSQYGHDESVYEDIPTRVAKGKSKGSKGRKDNRDDFFDGPVWEMDDFEL